ncbi:MAG TPA: ANTAR domain-containing protein [Mycobacteriales bacterium]
MPATGEGKRESDNTWPDVLVFPGGAAELADRLARLVELPADAALSPQRILRGAVELAASVAPGAGGASAALWHKTGAGWEPEVRVASLPDTGRLDDVELAGRSGPALDALAGLDQERHEPVDAPDLLASPRWPDYAAAAVGAGVRAVRAVARHARPGRLTLTLHAVRPGAFTGADTTVAVLVLAQAATALGNAERYGDARRDAHQLAEAMRARAVIEQAKGALLGRAGDPDAAFAELRRRSQAENVRLAEVAASVVAEAALDREPWPDPPDPEVRLGGVPGHRRGYRSQT